MHKTSKATPAVERLNGKYTITPGPLDTPCHLFTGALTSGKRYPVMGVANNRVDYAYKVSFEAMHGPVPSGPAKDGSSRYELHHRCEQKSCVNGEHIQVMTCREHRALHAELRRERKLSDQLRREQDRFIQQSHDYMAALMSAGTMPTEIRAAVH